MSGHFAYSWDMESFHGKFDTPEEAIGEAARDADRFWIGRCVPPPQPETYWDAEAWLEHVSCQADYCGDWAEDWFTGTNDQCSELESAVRKVIAEWLDRYSLRPRHCFIPETVEFTLRGCVYAPVKGDHLMPLNEAIAILGVKSLTLAVAPDDKVIALDEENAE